MPDRMDAIRQRLLFAKAALIHAEVDGNTVEFIRRDGPWLLSRCAELEAALKESGEWLRASLGMVEGTGPPNWDGIREHIRTIRAALERTP